jgi:hypothetical protein
MLTGAKLEAMTGHITPENSQTITPKLIPFLTFSPGTDVDKRLILGNICMYHSLFAGIRIPETMLSSTKTMPTTMPGRIPFFKSMLPDLSKLIINVFSYPGLKKCSIFL